MKMLLVSLTVCLAITGCKKAENQQGRAENSTENAPVAESRSIGDWASDSWDSAVSTGSRTVEGTTDWLSGLYHSARDQGLTKANSVKEWVSDDWHARGDWQYTILTLDSSNDEEIEKSLNQAGSQRWECYHVDTTNAQWKFFMKRSRRSYLSNLPLRDLANILPTLSGDGEPAAGE